jgi:hypothetical protein
MVQAEGRIVKPRRSPNKPDPVEIAPHLSEDANMIGEVPGNLRSRDYAWHFRKFEYRRQ